MGVELEMLTFSREQRCIEAAVAVASHPPSPLCIPLSLPLSALSSVHTDRDEKLAADQNTPPTIAACYLPRMLPPRFPLFPSLIFSPPPFFPLALFCPRAPSPAPATSASHFFSLLISCKLSLLSPTLPVFGRPPLVLPRPVLPLSFSSFSFCSSPHLSSPQLPRRGGRNRV